MQLWCQGGLVAMDGALATEGGACWVGEAVREGAGWRRWVERSSAAAVGHVAAETVLAVLGAVRAALAGAAVGHASLGAGAGAADADAAHPGLGGGLVPQLWTSALSAQPRQLPKQPQHPPASGAPQQ